MDGAVRVRAVLFRRPGAPLEVADVEVEEPGPHDVLVRMAAVGICGSDLHVVRGEWRRPTPMILGHEGSGIVEAVGSKVASVRPGDPIVLSWAPACGECAACRRRRRTACLPLREAIRQGTLPDGTTRLRVDGKTVYRMTTVGALAEHVLVPESAVLPLPAEIALDQAALLGCAALTGVGAVRTSGRVGPGSSVVVIGTGAVGQFCVQGARLAGATTIVAIDPSAGRRELALAVGATAVGRPEDAPELVTRLTGEGADAVFEAVGSSETASAALALARPGGFACLVGMPAAGARLDLDPLEFVNREKLLTGSVYGSEDPADALPGLLDEVRRGGLRLAPLVGPRFPLEQVGDAIEAALAASAGRVLITMQHHLKQG